MVNQKLTALNEITDPFVDDILYLVTDPATTKVSKKVTLDNVINSVFSFGHLYVKNGAGTQSLTGSLGTKIDQFTANGNYRDTVPDYINNHIELSKPGLYLLFWSVVFVGTADVKYKLRGKLDSAGNISDSEVEFTCANSTDTYHLSNLTPFALAGADNLSLNVIADDDCVFDVKTAHVMVVRVGSG